MDHSKKVKLIFLTLCGIAVILLAAIGFIVIDTIQKSKWTYERVDTYSAYDLQESASEYNDVWLRDPKLVAENFFLSEGYGESKQTTLIKDGSSKKMYLLKDETGLSMKVEVLQPELKGEFGIWMVKRHIEDPLPDTPVNWIAADTENAATGSDPKQVATDFFVGKGYGEPAKTALVVDGRKKLYQITNKDDVTLKVEVAPPGYKEEPEEESNPLDELLNPAEPGAQATEPEPEATQTENTQSSVWQVTRYFIVQPDAPETQAE